MRLASAVTSLRWMNESLHYMVSAGLDGRIGQWDIRVGKEVRMDFELCSAHRPRGLCVGAALPSNLRGLPPSHAGPDLQRPLQHPQALHARHLPRREPPGCKRRRGAVCQDLEPAEQQETKGSRAASLQLFPPGVQLLPACLA